jgi:hypothetical protein
MTDIDIPALLAEVEQWRATYGETALRDAQKIMAERQAALAEVDRLRAEWDRLVNERADMLGIVAAAKKWRAQFGEFGPLDSADTPAGDLSDAIDAYTKAAVAR